MIFPRSGFRRKKQHFYTVLFFSDKNEKPRGVKLSREALIVSIVLFILLISAIALVIVIHTPVKYIVFPETFAESRERAKKMQSYIDDLKILLMNLRRLNFTIIFYAKRLGRRLAIVLQLV